MAITMFKTGRYLPEIHAVKVTRYTASSVFIKNRHSGIEQQQQMAEHIREAFSFCAEFCIQYILVATAIPNDRRCNPCPYLSGLHNQVQLLRAQALHMNGWLPSSAVAS